MPEKYTVLSQRQPADIAADFGSVVENRLEKGSDAATDYLNNDRKRQVMIQDQEEDVFPVDIRTEIGEDGVYVGVEMYGCVDALPDLPEPFAVSDAQVFPTRMHEVLREVFETVVEETPIEWRDTKMAGFESDTEVLEARALCEIRELKSRAGE